MRVALRIVLGLGLPLLFAGLTLVFAWNLVDGPSAPWDWVLGFLILILVLLTGFGFLVFALIADFAVGGMVAVAACIALFATGVSGADEFVLFARGQDVSCVVGAVTASNVGVGYAPSFDYALACDGGGPTVITAEGQQLDDVAEGQRVLVRYDPAGGATTTLSRDAGDGGAPLIVAAVSLAVLLALGVAIGLRRPPAPRSLQ